MAQDMNNITSLAVREAGEGDHVKPGEILFAKSGYHMVFDRGGRVSLQKTPTLWGVRPSADVTMVSAVPAFGQRLVGLC